MGQVETVQLSVPVPSAAGRLCCRPAVVTDSSPIGSNKVVMIDQHFPTLLLTPTAHTENKFRAIKATPEDASNASPNIDKTASDRSGQSPHGPNRASSKTPWAPTSQVDVTTLEAQAVDGPNRASGPTPFGSDTLAIADGAPPADTTSGEQQEPAVAAAAPQAATRSKEERKALHREQKAQAKERLRPFLTKNGFSGPNAPRRRLFRTQFPIHCAVSQNNAEVVKLLILAGADISKSDSAGRTAQELARRESSRSNPSSKSSNQVHALLTEAQRRRAAKMARRTKASENARSRSDE
eukprot:TRINITY_DN92169_c0_g1_i1.p1 TRINITY_DN92169_c0_g1~~TRINITY_DN92169_c0_g1_i1.p1  ORF type:complete len:296 (-),score=46.37 TRINITY_DN92169_c0_g1_i1:137-1024(-)